MLYRWTDAAVAWAFPIVVKFQCQRCTGVNHADATREFGPIGPTIDGTIVYRTIVWCVRCVRSIDRPFNCPIDGTFDRPLWIIRRRKHRTIVNCPFDRPFLSGTADAPDIVRWSATFGWTAAEPAAVAVVLVIICQPVRVSVSQCRE